MSKLEIIIAHRAWRKIPGLEAKMRKVAKAAQESLPKKFHFPTQATLLLADDEAVQSLNRRFLGKDKPTNVLSFPQYEPAELPKIGKEKGVHALGDIAIAHGYTIKEAKDNNKLLLNHAIHLMIHGLLHLFGYDHQTDQDANKMERLEKRIMTQLNYPDPYGPTPAASRPRPSQRRTRKQ